MELSRYEMAAVKKTAQIVKPKRAKLDKLYEKREKLNIEIEALRNEIDLWEAPIRAKHGFTSEQILSGKADLPVTDTVDSAVETSIESMESMDDTYSSDPMPIDYNCASCTSTDTVDSAFDEPEF